MFDREEARREAAYALHHAEKAVSAFAGFGDTLEETVTFYLAKELVGLACDICNENTDVEMARDIHARLGDLIDCLGNPNLRTSKTNQAPSSSLSLNTESSTCEGA